MEEIWKSVVGWEGLYEVSNLGRVKSLSKFKRTGTGGFIKKDTIMHGCVKKNGYINLSLHLEGYHKTYSIHKLVAQAFIPNPENKPQINHINGIKTDNKLENLEWCTSSENHLHRFKVLGHKLSKKTIEAINKNRLLAKNTKIVFQYTKKGEFIKEWESVTLAGNELNITKQNISACCLGKLKSAGGFVWKYS